MQEGQKRELVLFRQRMQLAEQWRQDWVVEAEDGTTVEDVLDPAYWAHVAQDMTRWDRVEVRLETGEWLLELLAMRVEKNWVHMRVLQRYDLVDQVDKPEFKSGLTAKWRSQHHQWCVIRDSDNVVLQKNLPSRAAAYEWIASYEQAVAA